MRAFCYARAADASDVALRRAAARIGEADDHLNPMGTKSIGKIRITGTVAAIRDFAITPARLVGRVGGLPGEE